MIVGWDMSPASSTDTDWPYFARRLRMQAMPLRVAIGTEDRDIVGMPG
jgi:hypothetical protein